MAPKPTSHTWILLRGLAREKGHWGPFLEQFKQSVPGDDVIAIDLPGTGEYRDVSSPKTITGIFNFVRSQAISMARNQSQFKIVAVSMGGMIAMEWMRQRSEDLSLCVLINSSSKVSAFYNRLRWQVWREFARVLTLQAAKERERSVIEMLINSSEAKELALPLWTKIATERPISYINFFNQLLAAASFKGLEHPGPVPTLILSGLGDKFTDPSCSSVLSERLGWPIERHAWGGHDLPWDDGPWVIEKIRAFNQSLP
jgi:pimeloyl-[acyl-carrier protein] methyl ester esterase